MNFNAKFADGLPYAGFLEKYATPDQKQRWKAVYDQVRLTDAQIQLLRGFVREMKVLVTAGAWCGDCVEPVPDLRPVRRDDRPYPVAVLRSG